MSNKRNRSDSPESPSLVKKKALKKSNNPPEEPVAGSSGVKNKRRILEDDEIDGASQNQELTGSIQRIYVRNFMCHSALEIKLNKRINFIIGRNGSGKSAILTSLVVGLGGRAMDTNRGKTIKNFIKTGESVCTIEIVLNNEGMCAYNPEQYGDKIIIIRRITGTSSTYKVKSAFGQIISNSGREVTKICDALNIQVNNPICILNQDTSRNFLNSNDPKRKYALFMRATNLENIDDYYKNISQDRDTMSDKLKQKKEAFHELEMQMKNWDNKLKMIESLETYQNELKSLEIELYWSQHQQLIAQHEQIKKEVDHLNEEYETLNNKIANLNEGENADRLNNIIQKIEEIETELQKFEHRYQDIRNKCKTLQEHLSKKQLDLKNKKAVTEQKTKEHDSFSQEVNKIISRAEMIATQRMQQKKEIEDITNELNQLQAQLTTAETELQHRLASIQNFRDNETKLREDIKGINDLLGQKKAQIRSLTNQTNIISLYGQNMVNCLQEIERQKQKFHELPRGPLGKYIKVKDRKWAGAIELFLKHGLLRTFCVTDSHDYKMLDKIFSTVFRDGSKPQIISSKFFHQVHDVSRHRVQPPRGYKSLQDALEISDPVVENCLIDRMRIETILLLPKDEEAMRFLSNAENVPPNCSKCITLNGDLYFPYPDYKSYAVAFKPATLLQASTADVIKQFQSDIKDLEQKKIELDNKLHINQQNYVSQNASLAEHEAHVNELRQRKIHIQHQKRKLEYKLDPEDRNTDILIQELEEMKKQIETAKQSEEQCTKECEILQKKIDEYQAKLNEVKETIKTLQNRLEPLQIEKNNEESKQNERQTRCDIFKQKLADLKKRIQQKKATEKEFSKQVKEHLSKKKGNPIENPRSEDEIEHAKNVLRNSIDNIQSQNDDPEYVREMYFKSQEKYTGAKNVITQLSNSLKLIEESIDQRMNDYTKIVRRVGKIVEKMFHNVLSLRKYEGHIKIDHDKKELEIHVQTQTNITKSSDTRTLSGGERSYATVAFIMALWRCVKFPFYFMDEFDVFMDKVNRRIIMDLLLQHADEHPECQFAFLTPQDISNVSARPELTIHRMHDPERETD